MSCVGCIERKSHDSSNPSPVQSHGFVPLPAKNPQPVPEFDFGIPGVAPIRPAFAVCGASYVRKAIDQPAEDTTHAADRDCGRPACAMGMCVDHVYEHVEGNEKYEICFRCWRDLQIFAREGIQDPWFAVIAQDNAELADWIKEQQNE